MKPPLRFVGLGSFPVPIPVRKKVLERGPLTKAEFGLLLKRPQAEQLAKIDTAVGRALFEPQRSAVHLRNVLRGHRSSLAFRILQTNVAAAWRFVHKGEDQLVDYPRVGGCN